MAILCMAINVKLLFNINIIKECWIREAEVAGSNPVTPTNRFKYLSGFCINLINVRVTIS